jgi:hypothetical protein
VKLPIEILCGGRVLVDLMESGAGPEALRSSWRSDVDEFLSRRERYLLYE